MASPYKSDSVTFDNLFDPDIVGDGPTAAGFRADGKLLKYAHIKYGSKRANVGYRVDDDDVSNLWAKKGSATYELPFDGNTYTASALSPSGGSGTVSARLSLTLSSNGTFQIVRSVNNGPGGSGGGTTTVDSGRWLPSGDSASEYQVRFVVTDTAGSPGPAISNGASSYSALTSGRSISSTNTHSAASIGEADGIASIRVDLKKVSTGSVQESGLQFSTSATGFG